MTRPASLDRPLRVDCHAHVYDLSRYPFHGTRGFDASDNEVGTAEQFACVLDAHGFTHGLLINPLGGYGTDNRCLLEVLERHKGRFKGVAVVAHGTPEADFERMSAAGVVGLRFNLNFPASPALDAEGADRTLALAREQGWFAQVHYEGETFLRALPLLERSGLPIVVDHCGRPDAKAGVDQPAFRALLDLGRSGRAVVKLSGAFRFGGEFPYTAADTYAQALIEAFGIDRCVWGSDWPYLRARHRVDHATLLAALHRWLPDAADRQKVLGDNPARIFGFKPLATTA
ncbi:MAG: amidohydrolase family protein [Burkholderiales bacterium]|jgi:predicted TIM-barrel fold metal-dependent hydrolase|nr:amidohydrolase family protein [Burkholderiales bacterium]